MFDGSMTVCFHTLSCPSQLVGGVNRSRACLKDWPFATPSAKPASVLLHTDGNDSILESKAAAPGSSSLMGTATSRPVFSQPNTVGVIGGVSATSTLTFLARLVGWSSKDGEESLPFIVCSDPVVNIDLSSREKSTLPYLSLRTTSRFHVDRARVVENLRRKRVFLENAGARCIVMPCNILHAWHYEIADGCSVPFLHVGECVAKELKTADLRPVEAGSNVRIGVLATDAVLAAGFYQEKLQNLGFEVVSPDKATMEHTVIPAVEALGRKDMEGARTLLRIALQVLLVKAVSTIILASDDMRGLLPRDDPLLKKCFDPLDALARSTAEWAQSVENTHNNT